MFAIKDVRNALKKDIPGLTDVVSFGFSNNIPIPVLGASLSYFSSMTSEILPANFLQGLRDYFGAHTYERTDRKGVFHTQWSDLK